MPITNTDEFLDYSSFNSTGGITTSDTFNSWRKKTNGIINELDRAHDLISNISISNITASQLSLGAPTWTEAGALQTYNNGAGTFNASAITSTSLNAGSGAITTTGAISGGSITSSGNINGVNITGVNIKVTGIGPTGLFPKISPTKGLSSNAFQVGDNYGLDLRPGSPTFAQTVADGAGFSVSEGGYAYAKAIFVAPTHTGIKNGNDGDGGQGNYYFYVGQTGECSVQSLKVDNQINAKGLFNLPDIPGSKTPGSVNNKGLALNFDARPFEGSSITNIVNTTIYNGRGVEIAKFVGLTKAANFAGDITSGAITCTSLNAGSGTITTTGNAIAATPTLSTHLTTKGYVDGMFAYGTLNSVTSPSTLPFFEFTSIPAAVKRITLMLGAASTNGTSQLAIVLGTSSGYDTSGYTSSVSFDAGRFSTTSSFAITENTAAADGYSGCIVLNRYVPGVNTWILTGTIISQNNGYVHSSGGIKALGTGNVLDRIKITTVGGVNIFDGGSTNIMFEY